MSINLRDIKLIDITPVMEGVGECLHFEMGGKSYTFECWTTHNSGGQDFYEDGAPTTFEGVLDDEEQEVLEEYLNEILGEYGKAYDKHVNPALELAVRSAIGDGTTDAILAEPKFAPHAPEEGA